MTEPEFTDPLTTAELHQLGRQLDRLIVQLEERHQPAAARVLTAAYLVIDDHLKAPARRAWR